MFLRREEREKYGLTKRFCIFLQKSIVNRHFRRKKKEPAMTWTPCQGHVKKGRPSEKREGRGDLPFRELKGRKEFFDQKRAKMRERADVRVEPDISLYDFNAETNLFIIGIFD